MAFSLLLSADDAGVLLVSRRDRAAPAGRPVLERGPGCCAVHAFAFGFLIAAAAGYMAGLVGSS